MYLPFWQGIGREISIALANTGANLALLDIHPEDLTETKSKCEKYDGVSVSVFECNITDVSSIRSAFATISSTLGPVSILVNNAGVSHGKLASEDTFEGFWSAIEVNFKGTMACIFEVLNGMRERKDGCIVNLASRAATIDMPTGLSYCSSKAAVARATATLQEELELEGLGEHVHTYSLHPGGVWGAMVTSGFIFPETRMTSYVESDN